MDPNRNPNPEEPTSTCPFCGGARYPMHRLNGYDLQHCPGCRASSVTAPPSTEELAEYYNGFAFQMDKVNLKHILTPEIAAWFQAMNLPAKARMLDIGGGAGFFAHAFRHFGLGTSTFIDLDPTACRFAEEQLGLDEVICGDIEHITERNAEQYDFIYCRHVIEHLVRPTDMIDAAIRLLKPGGLFVVQFPNGASLEYFAFPKRLKPFAKKIKRSNGRGWVGVIAIMLSKENAFGLDPIRHLWAIPPSAVKKYLMNRKDLQVRAFHASTSDPVYSPYYSSKSLKDQVQAMLGRVVLSKIRGGAHGVVEIRKV